ncbi:crossover junction endodeoxyribonuclease ruvc [Heliomicrobium modesticaldum Ice1]|uniref:Crossover junction endodeoxyribonuclease RuvC n=1 Tax=Heliobacterium modesticaldum (strain ATCC 51547 / Ice1) TaxID=498761 RepID=RUVC_HELMI|nr:crossover junction endodeoxyribonuclease RuvC [Heliomicrobium modesticaldum]B0TF68.1 RecName: Full=Crossover junction endodeoxyribonuclease RuvC; AltName: Full=Holliday junction nuclease RuvC; AltName: Full=Holliday junction resolvase RuvC [Heliomicrobium modesticaldum Ice1]ABZ84385.1 crossover junction endodeoxyribonuclease ruvc [Heliomicrobium modesticaldum Ice1]
MVILGIDPGTAICGYGLIEVQGNRLSALAYGAVRTPAHTSQASRLQTIFTDLEAIIATYRPTHVAVEELFFNRNVTTALTVGQARGVILLAAARAGLSVHEYKPSQVKQAVVGYGRAEKQQVQQMVRVLLALEEIPKPDDVADALAVAICCAHSLTWGVACR